MSRSPSTPPADANPDDQRCRTGWTCCGDGCCSSTQYCCNEGLVVCCELDPPLGAGLEACCGDQCCATGIVCCDGVCCAEGQTCCGDTNPTCCDPDGCCENVCCGNSVVAGGGPTCGIDVYLKDITFGNDCNMYDEAPPCQLSNPNLCWGAGAALTGVDWADVNNPDHPICYRRATGMRLTVRLETRGSVPGTATLRVVGPDGVTGQGTFSVPCGTEERFVSFTTSPLPDVVKAYTPTGLSWSVQPPGATAFSPIGSTSHRIYLTFGSPTGSEPTNRRLNFLCYAAAGADTVLEVIEGVAPSGGAGVHEALEADPPCDGNSLDPFADPPCNGTGVVSDWRRKAGPPYVGECHHQTHLMNLATQLLGAGAGNEYCTYPSMPDDCDPTGVCGLGGTFKTAGDAGITWDIDGDGTIGEEQLVLRFDFDGGAGTNINAFEGAVEYAVLGRHYAVWPSLSADSKCGMLMAIQGMGAKQCWDRLDTPEWECIRNPTTGAIELVAFPVCAPGCP